MQGLHHHTDWQTPCHPSLLLAQKLFPVFCGAGSAQLPKHSREVLLRFEAAGHGDIQDAHVGGSQHPLGALDSLVQVELVRASVLSIMNESNPMG
jgi:hypothetical protein